MIPLGVLGASRQQAAPSGAWSPSDLGAALAAWYDASDPGTLVHSTPGRVQQWNDKSSNARHISNVNSNYHPYSTTRTLNGLTVLEWTSGLSWASLTSAALTLPQPYTVAWAGKFDSTAAYRVAISLANGSCYAISTFNTGPTWRISNGSNLDRGTSDTSPHAFVSIHNGATSAIRVDGAQVGTVGNAGATNPVRINVGGPVDGSNSACMLGIIGEVILVAGALSGSTLTDLEAYLADKWGI